MICTGTGTDLGNKNPLRYLITVKCRVVPYDIQGKHVTLFITPFDLMHLEQMKFTSYYSSMKTVYACMLVLR